MLKPAVPITNSMKNKPDQYRLADIIIATILGGMLGLVVGLLSNLLRQPLLFRGDVCVAGLLVGACFGIVGGRTGGNLLNDALQQLRHALWHWW
jgi:hypothetical protein